MQLPSKEQKTMPIPITPALLTRYHEGRCTPEEQAAVLDWLADPLPGDASPLPEWSSVHGSRIWRGIAQGMRPRRYYRGMAAAIVLLTACFFVFRPAPPAVLSAGNHAGTGTLTAELGGLGIALSPKSIVRIREEEEGIRQIDFNGSVEVTNRTGHDVRLVFGSGNRTRQTIRLAAGRSCVAVEYHFRSDEIVVVKRLLDLPPVLLTRIRNDFRAI